MRRRLYFLMPDVGSVRRTVDELLLARIDEGHIHVLAKDGTSLEGLPEANLFQKSDLVHALESGMMIGGITGAVAGIVVYLLPTAGISGGGLILATALTGALIGAWVSGMIGTDVRNSRLKQFEKAISAGKILLMVDTPKSKVDEIKQLVKRHHPEADEHGVEPTIPAFP